MGMAGFIRKHIRNYSNLSEPLIALQLTEGRSLKSQPSKKRLVPWTDETQQSWILLRHAIATAPLLNHIDWNIPFAIIVDASTNGIGSALYQPRYVGEPLTADNVVSFRSHALKKYERGYAGSPYKLELLAVITALGDYHDFVWGRKFTMYTDHRALTHMHSSSEHNRHLMTWLDILYDYQFDIIHIEGIMNGFADALSRLYPTIWGIPAITKSQLIASGGDEVLLVDSLKIEITEDHRQLILEYHTLDHYGIKHVLKSLSIHGHSWPRMSLEARAVLESCGVCQDWNVGKKVFCHYVRSFQLYLVIISRDGLNNIAPGDRGWV